MSDTPTPRTDAESIHPDGFTPDVPTEFARTLERELTAATARIAELERDQEFRDKMGIKTLDAKWLDPACWEGCQSLVIKRERNELRAENAALKGALSSVLEDLKLRALIGDDGQPTLNISNSKLEELFEALSPPSAPLAAVRQAQEALARMSESSVCADDADACDHSSDAREILTTLNAAFGTSTP